MTQTILFSGGGSGGHLTPAIAVADALQKKSPEAKVEFVVTDRKDEISLLQSSGVSYSTIHAGKFPRGLSVRLITFPFFIIISLIESALLIRRMRPAVVFSKGGYASVPVCLIASLHRIPIILHASDSVPNLSDRLIGRLARKICTGFSPNQFPHALRQKTIQTGNPVRSIIIQGSRDAGRRITGFSGNRPVIMVIGGSQGSLSLNQQIAISFDELLSIADVIHITGQGKATGKNHARYFSRAFVTDDLPHLYALADIVVTRAGAGVLSELAMLSKPAVVVPLAGVAHDHQVRNAEALADADACAILREEKISELPSLLAFLLSSPERRADLGKSLHAYFPSNAADRAAAVTLDALP